MENFLKSHKPMSFVLAFVVMSLLAITAYSFSSYPEAFQGLLVVLGAFAITYAVFWFQSGRIGLQALGLIIVGGLVFLFAQLLSPSMTIPVLSGYFAAGSIEIVFEVLFGFIANNIRAADKAEIAQINKDAWERVNELTAQLEQKGESKTAPAQTAAPKQAAPAQPAVNQNKLIVWLMGLVFSVIAKKEDTEFETNTKLMFARLLVEAIIGVFNVQFVKQQPQGGLRPILRDAISAGYMVWLDESTIQVDTEEKSHFSVKDGDEVVYLAIKPSELQKTTPVVDAAITAETDAAAKAKQLETKNPVKPAQQPQGKKHNNHNGARVVSTHKGDQK